MTDATPVYEAAAHGDYTLFDAGQVNWLRKDSSLASGFWRCTPEEQPEVYEAVFEQNETVLILEGRIRVEVVGGHVHELGPGDAASFVKGTTGRWTVIEPVLEFFIYC